MLGSLHVTEKEKHLLVLTDPFTWPDLGETIFVVYGLFARWSELDSAFRQTTQARKSLIGL